MACGRCVRCKVCAKEGPKFRPVLTMPVEHCRDGRQQKSELRSFLKVRCLGSKTHQNRVHGHYVVLRIWSHEATPKQHNIIKHPHTNNKTQKYKQESSHIQTRPFFVLEGGWPAPRLWFRFPAAVLPHRASACGLPLVQLTSELPCTFHLLFTAMPSLSKGTPRKEFSLSCFHSKICLDFVQLLLSMYMYVLFTFIALCMSLWL